MAEDRKKSARVSPLLSSLLSLGPLSADCELTRCISWQQLMNFLPNAVMPTMRSMILLSGLVTYIQLAVTSDVWFQAYASLPQEDYLFRVSLRVSIREG